MELRRIGPATAVAATLGVLIGLAGVATLVGMPWQYTQGGVVNGVFRALGALLGVGVGVGLVWLSLVE